MVKLGWIWGRGVAGMMRRCWVCVVLTTPVDVKGFGATCRGNKCNVRRQDRKTKQKKYTYMCMMMSTDVTCLMLCAGTMGTDILTAPAPTTIGLASGREATSDLMYNFYS